MRCARPRLPLKLLLIAGTSMVTASGSVQAASSGTVVGATVPSATALDLAGCLPGAAGVTSFGSVTPGSSSVTSLDCVVEFGSSNDTSQLRLVQQDRSGAGMWSYGNGDVQGTFGTTGVMTRSVAAGAGSDSIRGVVRQSDGRLVLSGPCTAGSFTDNCVVRANADGSPDATFAGTGTLQVDLSPIDENDTLYHLGEASDATLIAAGHCETDAVCTMRLTEDGDLAVSYGTGGVAAHAIPGASGVSMFAGHTYPDASTVLAGSCTIGGVAGMCVVKLTSSGVLDPDFGSSGVQHVDVTAGSDIAYSMALAADGDLVLAGRCSVGAPTGDDGCIVRLRDDGSTEPTFGGGSGFVTRAIAPGAGSDMFRGVALLPDGDIVVTGQCAMGATGDDMCFARHDFDGDSHDAFGTLGSMTVAAAAGAGNETPSAGLRRLDDGRLLAAGYCDNGASGNDICAVRIREDGVVDSQFGSSGVITQAIGSAGASDQAFTITAADDGRLRIGGRCDMGASGTDLCMVGLDGNVALPQYGPGTDWSTPAAAHFGVCLSSVASGATAVWTANAGCPAADGAHWQPVPVAASMVASTTVTGTTSAEARLRFGLRTTIGQAPGTYVAPIEFSVVAP